jgi:hypothetical protein
VAAVSGAKPCGPAHLCDGGASDRGHANTKANQALLVDGHVEHALRAELVEQPHRAAEDAAERDVLAKEHRVLVGGERHPQRIVDRGEHGHRGRLVRRGGGGGVEGPPPWPQKSARRERNGGGAAQC